MFINWDINHDFIWRYFTNVDSSSTMDVFTFIKQHYITPRYEYVIYARLDEIMINA